MYSYVCFLRDKNNSKFGFLMGFGEQCFSHLTVNMGVGMPTTSHRSRAYSKEMIMEGIQDTCGALG